MCINSVVIFCAVAESEKNFVEMKREELSKAIVHIATEQAVIVLVTLLWVGCPLCQSIRNENEKNQENLLDWDKR